MARGTATGPLARAPRCARRLLAWSPYTLLDAGFQLSFAAVAAIFVVTPRVVRALEGYPLSRGLAQLLGVSTACGLATAPVTWLQFHVRSHSSTVPANVVGGPLVVEVLGLALADRGVAPFAPPVAAALAWLNGWGAAWFVALRARCSELAGRADHVRPLAAVLALGAAGQPPMLGAWRTSAS